MHAEIFVGDDGIFVAGGGGLGVVVNKIL